MTIDPRSGPERRPPASEELPRLVFDSVVGFAVIAMDRDGVVTMWNEGAERLIGYAWEEIIGRDGDAIFTPEDRVAGAPQQERATALANGRAEDERWHLRKDGSRFWGSGLLMPLADGSGFAKIMRDLTEQRQAQDRLARSEELFRLLATNIPQLVFRTRGTGERTWGSPQWIAFTGLSLEDSLGLGWMDAVHPDDRPGTAGAWHEAWQSGQYYAEHRIRRSSDGQYRWHQTRARPVSEDGDVESDWVGTSTDVHEMRGLQERQKVLLAEIQHRTRNLLAIVQSLARQTQRSSGSLEAFMTEFEGRLRTLSRVQSMLAGADQRPIELQDLIGAELRAHGGDEDVDRVTIRGPPIRLSPKAAQTFALAIHELATNAIKHGALGQPDGRLAVDWRAEDLGPDQRLVLDWIESGVRLPDPGLQPPRKGYGSELIERALPYQLGAETHLDFGHDGVRCRISMAIKQEVVGDG